MVKSNPLNKKITLDTIFNSLCKAVLFMLILSLYAFNDINALKWSAILFTGILLFIYSLKKQATLSVYLLWSAAFFLTVLLSNLWTFNLDWSIFITRGVLKNVLIGNILILFLDVGEKVVYLLRCLVISGLVFVIRLIIMFPVNTWGSARIGNEYWNANLIGLYLALAALAALQLVITKNAKKYNWIFMLIFSLVVFLTGSRKAFFLLVMGMAVIYYLNLKTVKKSTVKKFLIIICLAVAAIIIYRIIMTVPLFYDVLGNRIEGLLASVTGKGYMDESTRERMLLIDKGIELYKQKPLLGYGIAAYETVAGFGKGMYAHNNYIELLVDIGTVGTLLYYSIYLYIIFNLFKLRKKNKLTSFFLVFVVLLLILEYGMVSYYTDIYSMLTASSFAVIRLVKKEQNHLRIMKYGVKKYYADIR